MAMKAKEIKEWLATIDDEKDIAIDEGAMCLVVRHERSYCEVGAIPLVDTGHGFDDFEPGWEMHL